MKGSIRIEQVVDKFLRIFVIRANKVERAELSHSQPWDGDESPYSVVRLYGNGDNFLGSWYAHSESEGLSLFEDINDAIISIEECPDITIRISAPTYKHSEWDANYKSKMDALAEKVVIEPAIKPTDS